MLARRLQVQDRVTTQVADAPFEVLHPRGLVVVANATHLCMAMRGVERQSSTTTTVATRGALIPAAGQREPVPRAIGH